MLGVCNCEEFMFASKGKGSFGSLSLSPFLPFLFFQVAMSPLAVVEE